MQTIDYYGKQQVDWNDFTHAAILIGMFVATISAILLAITMFVAFTDSFFFAGFLLFGLVIVIEGTIASFFKVD